MKIEKLRNNHKKEIIIGTILTVVIGGALTFKLTHSKYRVTQSIDLGSGVINYTSPDFKIMAIKISDDGENYSDSNTIPTSGYKLNTTNSSCKVNDVKDNSITINYHDGVIGIDNLTQKGTKCYLYFDKIVGITIENIIAKYATATEKSSFSSVATSDEGVFKAEDGMYGSTEENKIYTYYWRGATTTNHVLFADKCWRIVRINGDKTMRLIYNGSVIKDGDKDTCAGNGANANSVAVTNRVYNSSQDNASYVGWTYNTGSQRPEKNADGTIGEQSSAKSRIETWYNNQIGNNTTYDSNVEKGNFCNDRDVASGYTWAASGSNFNFAGYKRVETYKPTFNCPSGDVYILKVGLITMDEIMYAGGKDGRNSSYYLYNGQNYWTMSPWLWSIYGVAVAHVNTDGSLGGATVTFDYGLRPVINLKADTTFATGGTGAQNNPYAVR